MRNVKCPEPGFGQISMLAFCVISGFTERIFPHWSVPGGFKQEVEKLIESTSSNGEGKRWFKDCGSRHLEFEILASGLDSSVTYKVYSANYFSQLNDWNEYWIQVEPGEESGDNTYGNKFNESDGSPQISITFWESGCGYSVRCIKD